MKEVVAVLPNLTAEWLDRDVYKEDRWVFRGWTDKGTYSVVITAKELEMLAGHAHMQLDAGRISTPHLSDESLYAVSPYVTARIEYQNLVETFLEVGGFDEGISYTFRLDLPWVDELVVIQRTKLTESAHARVRGADNLPL